MSPVGAKCCGFKSAVVGIAGPGSGSHSSSLGTQNIKSRGKCHDLTQSLRSQA